MTKKLLVLAFAVALLAVVLACGASGACYSDIPGCESTVAVAQTAIAAAATAAASK